MKKRFIKILSFILILLFGINIYLNSSSDNLLGVKLTYGLDVSADVPLTDIYFTGVPDSFLYRIKSDGSGLIQLTSEISQNISVDRQNKWVYYNGVGGYICRVKTDGSSIRERLYYNNGYNFYITPDGKKMYYVNPDSNNSLYEANTDGSAQYGLLNNVSSFYISKDMQYIYADANYYGGLIRKTIIGGTWTQICTQRAQYITVTDDNQWIYFQNASDNYYLYKVKPDGTGLSLVDRVIPGKLEISKDSQYLYYYGGYKRLRLSDGSISTTTFTAGGYQDRDSRDNIYYGNSGLNSNINIYDISTGITKTVINKRIAGITIPKNMAPSLLLSNPTANQVYSLNSGYNAILLAGSVSDSDIGDMITVRYMLDSDVTHNVEGIVNTAGSFTNTSINVSELAEGNHNLSVWAEDSRGAVSGIKIVPFKIDKTPPVIGLVSTSSSSTSVIIMGSAIDSMTELSDITYRFKIEPNVTTAWIANTSFTQSSLMSNMQYKISFEARDVVGNISGTLASVYTKAATPNVILSNITPFGSNIHISDTNSAQTYYQINIDNGTTQYLTPEGTLTTSPVWITLPNKNITVTGLTPSTTYTFTAKARNAEGIETAWSAPISGTTLIEPPAAPANITAVSTSNNISVVWDPAAGSTGYDIEADGVIHDNGTYTSYNHTGLTPYTQHIYRVRAKNEGGAGPWSAPITKYTQQDTPNTPFNIDTAATNTSIIVTWKPIPGATAYDIEADDVLINNHSSTNYVHTGLIPGTMHAYRVRSINSGGKSEWSNEVLVSTQTDTPIIPSNIVATPDSGQITVNWDSIPGTTYEIEVDGNIKDSGMSTSFVHTGLLPGTEHNYRVRTLKSGSTSDWSVLTIATVPIDEFGTPRNIKMEAEDTNVSLSWSPVVDAVSYQIEIDGVVLDNGTETSCIFDSLTPNTLYTYRIKAIGEGKESEWTEPFTVTTFALSTPGNINTEATESAISITWDVVAGAEEYELDIDGQLVQGIETNAYTHAELPSNTQRSYRIRAVNSDGTSNWSKQTLKSTLAAGNNMIARVITKSKTDSITLIWKPIENVSEYEIEIDGVTIQNTTDTSYIHNNLEAGTTHSYKVRAINGEWSDNIQAATLPNTLQAPSNIVASSTTNTILITWDKVENAQEYELEMDGSIINVSNSTSYLHKGLPAETQHTYKVRAKNISSTGTWGEAVTVSTKNSQVTYNITTEQDEIFNLAITAKDIENPTDYTYTITYNMEELEVVDLCGTTARIDLIIGNAIGSDIQILQFEEGIIVFKKLGTNSGNVWNGFINSIRFKSKLDGVSKVEYRFD